MSKTIRASRNHMIGVKPPNVKFNAAVTMPTMANTTTRTRGKSNLRFFIATTPLVSLLAL
jgi:hypothetical protein